MVQESIILGHKVSFKGIEVDLAKIDVIRNLPVPTSVTGVRSFLGHAGFYRLLILGFSTLAKPLNELLLKDVEFNFDERCLTAFNCLKQALISAPIVQALDWSLPFELICDASDISVGAVLDRKRKEDTTSYAISVKHWTQHSATTLLRRRRCWR